MTAATGTIVVALTWLCAGIVIVGCGSAARRLLLRITPGPAVPARLHRADMWIGLAVVLAVLQIWSLVGPVGTTAAAVLGLLGVAGFASGLGTRRRITLGRTSLVAIGATAFPIAWLANRALANATGYDLGLYHATAIAYDSRFGTVPGLGNLHFRLGSGNSHFLLVAALGRWPWTDAGFRLANGLLAALLFVEIASRLAKSGESVTAPFARRIGLLMIPAVVIASVGTYGTGMRLSSPDLDFATFVLVAVGALYLVECIEANGDVVAALACASALANAATSRLAYWPVVAIAAVIALVAVLRARRTVSRLLLIASLPAVLLLGSSARQAVLSGYPFFPSTVVSLPVDWRMPATTVHELNHIVATWARAPHKDPDTVTSWGWLRPWLRARVSDADTLGPLLLLALLPPVFVLRSTRDAAQRRRWLFPLLAVLAISLPTLIAWFFAAPEPRFVLAPLWLVPIALLAWALPSPAARDSPSRARNLLLYGSVGFVALLGVAADASRGAFRLVSPHGNGPLRTSPLPDPTLRAFTTRSGLHLTRPASGDQCWGVLLCTPHVEDDLGFRRSGDLSAGFEIVRRPASLARPPTRSAARRTSRRE